jgi:hypothetical protein
MELLVGKRTIYGKWVYKLTQGLDHVETCKAKPIVKGDEQCAWIDFEETFYLVVKWGTLWIIIASATHSH